MSGSEAVWKRSSLLLLLVRPVDHVAQTILDGLGVVMVRIARKHVEHAVFDSLFMGAFFGLGCCGTPPEQFHVALSARRIPFLSEGLRLVSVSFAG